MTPDHTEDRDEQFDLTVRCPGVAFDIAAKGMPRVLVIQKLADSVTEYDESRGNGSKSQLGYLKNAISGATEDDAVYQCVYLADNPISGTDLNDPGKSYPVPESRLVPYRAERADPVDDSPRRSPRDAVRIDALTDLFGVSFQFDASPDPSALETMAGHAGFTRDGIMEAREAAELATDENGGGDGD